jgi:nitrate reductase cytochrome c-type subunit
MKRPLLASLLLVFATGCATLAIDDSNFSLRKGDVFDQPTPVAFDFQQGDAGTGRIAPLPGSGIPPMISHAIDDFLPITPSSNTCVTCHGKPGAIGKAVAKGEPAPAPANHYAKGTDGTLGVSGLNYNCTSCHAPQAGVKPLVVNTSR